MKRKKYPVVFVCQDAADKASREATEYYRRGLKRGKMPWEAAMYPLAFLKTRVHKSPLDLLSLSEIEYIVITHVLYPPDRFKNHGPNHAGFLEGANDYLNPAIDGYFRRYPLLEACCKMHSHPMGGNSLSSGDLRDNVFNAYSWFRNKGLNTMFSFILTPQVGKWRFNAYGLTDWATQAKLEVRFISRNHSLARTAFAQPYWQTPAGAAWCDENKALLKQDGYSVTRYHLRRGWRRYAVTAQGRTWLICLPPNFPQETVKVYAVSTSNQILWSPLELAGPRDWIEPQGSFQNLKLTDLFTFLLHEAIHE